MTGPEPVLDDSARMQLAAEYASGSTIADLAGRYGVSETTIRRALPARRRPGQARTDVPTSKIVTLREDAGLTWSEIGVALGIPWSTAASRYARYELYRARGYGGTGL